MAKGLRGTHAGTPREKSSRERTAKQLGEAKEFAFLAADEVKERGLERRGERVATVAHYALRGGEMDYRVRFLLNEAGLVADFAMEMLD
jgi:hypothetical protein